MTDYFAILQQPRQPCLDSELLKQRYQELTLAKHPDRGGSGGNSGDFAKITEAYRVLSDPKLRLQHLLQLAGAQLPPQHAIPSDLGVLFSRVGEFVHSADQALARLVGTTTALTASITKSQISNLRTEADELLKTLRQLFSEASQETQKLNDSWPDELESIANLYRRFAFLSRWIQQVEERLFRLSA